jgi:hypothetical protein
MSIQKYPATLIGRIEEHDTILKIVPPLAVMSFRTAANAFGVTVYSSVVKRFTKYVRTFAGMEPRFLT